ncbi:MAG: amidohydrolase, partial [Candidatus Binatia bacterium]
AKVALANAKALGMRLNNPEAGTGGSGASTDSGNVSQVIPTFTLSFAVSQKPVAMHSRALTEAAQSECALNVAIDVAKALALTAGDLLDEVQLIEAARKEFEERGRHLKKMA